MPQPTVHVLLVEDDDIDAEEMRRSFGRLGIDNPLTIAKNGEEAWQVLKGENGHARLPRPYIIILDLNMPRLGGLELLMMLREDEELRQSVVFVLTTSDRQADKIAAYALQVAGYFLKTPHVNSADRVLLMLDNYCKLAELPPDTAMT